MPTHLLTGVSLRAPRAMTPLLLLLLWALLLALALVEAGAAVVVVEAATEAEVAAAAAASRERAWLLLDTRVGGVAGAACVGACGARAGVPARVWPWTCMPPTGSSCGAGPANQPHTHNHAPSGRASAHACVRAFPTTHLQRGTHRARRSGPAAAAAARSGRKDCMLAAIGTQRLWMRVRNAAVTSCWPPAATLQRQEGPRTTWDCPLSLAACQ